MGLVDSTVAIKLEERATDEVTIVGTTVGSGLDSWIVGTTVGKTVGT